jgi:molybdopterin synthase catalytic subunit
MFKIQEIENLESDYASAMKNHSAGGYVCFEGWVRNVNHGRDVLSLEYEAYEALAIKEGIRIIDEALNQFQVIDIQVIHTVGHLKLGDLAVWVGVISKHRGPAFDACEYVIDQLKVRVPIWKREHYVDGSSDWVECHECAKFNEESFFATNQKTKGYLHV